MQVAITAIFSTLQNAQSAADCMSICPDKAKNLQISTEYCDHGAVASASLFPGGYPSQLLDATPIGAAAAGRTGSALLRIRCSDQLSSFAARELAALGAEKITVTPLS